MHIWKFALTFYLKTSTIYKSISTSIRSFHVLNSLLQ
jgi:hypothetical protein